MAWRSAALVALVLAGCWAAAAQDAPFDVAALAAQSQGALAVGGTAQGELTLDVPVQWWAVPLVYGDTIFIAANAGPGAGLMPRLRLVSPDGALVALDDNPASSQNVLIRQFSAPSDGAYYLEVGALRQSVGAYTVLIGRLPATLEGQPTPTPLHVPAAVTASPAPAAERAPTSAPTLTPAPGVVSQGTLVIGQTVEGVLPAGARYSYTFEGAGGMPLVIDLTAPGGGSAPVLDPYLELYGPSGTLLFENDDADYFQINARLAIRLPVTGKYTVVARSFGDGSGGAYRLSVQIGALWE
ncbi:MAG: hypothetical protein JXB47_05630 [Anaerolineae bacterium]|nr:hypothetical protein [Anaerolineae bacterium]